MPNKEPVPINEEKAYVSFIGMTIFTSFVAQFARRLVMDLEDYFYDSVVKGHHIYKST